MNSSCMSNNDAYRHIQSARSTPLYVSKIYMYYLPRQNIYSRVAQTYNKDRKMTEFCSLSFPSENTLRSVS